MDKSTSLKDIHIVSYNCNSIRKSIDIINMLLESHDIILLQEILLPVEDIAILNDINKNYDFVVSPSLNRREGEGDQGGRPVGGLITFFKLELKPFITVEYINDFLIILKFSSVCDSFYIINVYLPYDDGSLNAFINYKSSIACIESFLSSVDISRFVITGDFNADPTKGRFWKSLL